jgi:hypothetical protein
MGLVFTVSAPSTVFTSPFCKIVADSLRSQYGIAMDLSSESDYQSAELGWSGWRLLQERAISECGADAIPHLLSMEAWCGAYLPVPTGIGAFEFPGETTKLDVACLDNLIAELELIGRKLRLPLDDDQLAVLFRNYTDDDNLVDQDMDVQTFTQLLPCARVARNRNQPLWIVK